MYELRDFKYLTLPEAYANSKIIERKTGVEKLKNITKYFILPITFISFCRIREKN